MYCKECGKQFENPNASFCTECGVSRGKGNNFCENCGAAKKSVNQDVCLECGSNFRTSHVNSRANIDYSKGISDKTKLITLLLWFFLGGFGAHQFYLGNNKRGVLYLILLGIAIITCGIGGIATTIFLIIDLVQLLTDKIVDGEGRPVIEWS